MMKLLWPDTFVEESNLTQHISMLRKALGESPQDRRYILTVPGTGYRFAQRPMEVPDGGDLVVHGRSIQTVTVEETESRGYLAAAVATIRLKPGMAVLSAAAFIALLALATFLEIRSRRTPLNEADLVLVADFVNATGEPVFDATLKTALTVKLAESPFFNLVPASTTRKTLGLMGRSADDAVVPPIARDICQREGAKAVVGGSILSLGEKYVLDLDTTNCLTGASLAHEQIEAANRDQVLDQLGRVIPLLRRKLGESVGSIQKFDTPIEQATTKSLTALKAYTKGDQKRAQGQEAESIPFYQMAIELDPDFAMAYTGLGSVNSNLQEPDLAAEYLRKAFERRQHLTEREKLSTQATYYGSVTRERDKVIETYKLWTEAYPRDFVPFINLGNEYGGTGQMENAIAASQQAMRLNPHHASSFGVLAWSYQRASRFAEAKAVGEKAVAEKLDNFTTHNVLYAIGFVEGDGPAMQKEVDWVKGKPSESIGTYYQAKAALSLGQLGAARKLFARARAIALEHGLKEQATSINNGLAQFEADLNNDPEARALANLSLRELPNSVRHRAFATLALARAGDAQHAESALTEVQKQPLLGTSMTEVILPSVQAAIDLDRKKPAAAIDDLLRATPYDLGADSSGVTTYYRGLAYLELKSGTEAAAQFQKILDNRGVVTTDIYWPLAHLGLARAYAQTGDLEKSLAQYRELLTIWKNADPDFRPLTAAKAEYKKLSERTAANH